MPARSRRRARAAAAAGARAAALVHCRHLAFASKRTPPSIDLYSSGSALVPRAAPALRLDARHQAGWIAALGATVHQLCSTQKPGGAMQPAGLQARPRLALPAHLLAALRASRRPQTARRASTALPDVAAAAGSTGGGGGAANAPPSGAELLQQHLSPQQCERVTHEILRSFLEVEVPPPAASASNGNGHHRRSSLNSAGGAAESDQAAAAAGSEQDAADDVAKRPRGVQGRVAEHLLGGGFDEALLEPVPTHTLNWVIKVRGRRRLGRGAKIPRCFLAGHAMRCCRCCCCCCCRADPAGLPAQAGLTVAHACCPPAPPLAPSGAGRAAGAAAGGAAVPLDARQGAGQPVQVRLRRERARTWTCVPGPQPCLQPGHSTPPVCRGQSSLLPAAAARCCCCCCCNRPCLNRAAAFLPSLLPAHPASFVKLCEACGACRQPWRALQAWRVVRRMPQAGAIVGSHAGEMRCAALCCMLS